MARRRRIASSFLAAFALVFAQFAVSAHVCTLEGQPSRAKAAANHICCAEDLGSKPSPGDGNVCVSHCQYGQATHDSAQPVPASLDSTGPALRITLPAEAIIADVRPAWRFAPVAAPPPPAILFGVLRI